jgi:hypothetical protein
LQGRHRAFTVAVVEFRRAKARDIGNVNLKKVNIMACVSSKE